jgi:hypothetical protein
VGVELELLDLAGRGTPTQIPALALEPFLSLEPFERAARRSFRWGLRERPLMYGGEQVYGREQLGSQEFAARVERSRPAGQKGAIFSFFDKSSGFFRFFHSHLKNVVLLQPHASLMRASWANPVRALRTSQRYRYKSVNFGYNTYEMSVTCP